MEACDIDDLQAALLVVMAMERRRQVRATATAGGGEWLRGFR